MGRRQMRKKKITSACPDGHVDVDGICVPAAYADGAVIIGEKITK